MAETTKIAWCRSTFNPWIGCAKVSPGCDHCYAEAQDARGRWDEGRRHWGVGVPRYRTSAANWRVPLAWNRKAARERRTGLGFWPVFCGSLCDVFDNEVPEEWRGALWELIEATPHLTWLLLSKRIGNAVKMLPRSWVTTPKDNVWLGASVVNQEEADRDIPKLLKTPAAKRFVSYEPALGPVDFDGGIYDGPGYLRGWHTEPRHASGCDGSCSAGRCPQPAQIQNERLDWIIIGGESSQGGKEARPFNLAWARSTIAQCRMAGVSVFVKQLGSAPFERVDDCRSLRVKDYELRWRYVFPDLKDHAGADPAEWPEDLRVQEWPR